MQYRNLGRSGLKISPICLGTMMFGGPTDEATSTRHRDGRRREAGMTSSTPATTSITAAIPEQVVGRAISNNRHDWVHR